jgi:DNA transposition AAA+ family ATPase
MNERSGCSGCLIEFLQPEEQGGSGMDDLRTQFLAFKGRSGLSYTAVGKGAKLAASAVKCWVEGNFDDREVGAEEPEIVAERLASWLMIELAKERVQNRLASVPTLISTPTFRKLHAGFALAKSLKKIFIGIGAPGSGKTTAALAFAQGRHDAWYWMCEPASGHLRESLNALASLLCCKFGSPTSDGLSRSIVKHLAGSGGLLIIDEAQHLSFQALEQLRVIAEKAGIGLALIGNSAIYSQMGGDERRRQSNPGGFDQLRSRIIRRLEIPPMTRDDVEPVAGLFGVRGDSELTLLSRIARKDGGLRDVVNVLQIILIEFDDGEVSVDRIIEVWQGLSGETLRPERAAKPAAKSEVARIGRAG